jgi:hypothetical protein
MKKMLPLNSLLIEMSKKKEIIQGKNTERLGTFNSLSSIYIVIGLQFCMAIEKYSKLNYSKN